MVYRLFNTTPGILHMKHYLTSIVFALFALTSLQADEHHYFQEFPKYAATDLKEFCNQGISISDYHLCTSSTEYIHGYWQGQRDAYSYVQERLLE